MKQFCYLDLERDRVANLLCHFQCLCGCSGETTRRYGNAPGTQYFFADIFGQWPSRVQHEKRSYLRCRIVTWISGILTRDVLLEQCQCVGCRIRHCSESSLWRTEN